MTAQSYQNEQAWLEGLKIRRSLFALALIPEIFLDLFAVIIAQVHPPIGIFILYSRKSGNYSN